MRLGIHMSQKGGFEKNVKWVAEIGCKTVQIFPGNPTAWKMGEAVPGEVEKRKKMLKEHCLKPLVIHSAYLINLASSNSTVLNKSKILLNNTMERAALYGSPYVVIHAGNHGGQGTKDGLKQVIDTIGELMPAWPDSVMLLLENTAGSGTALGSSLEELATVVGSFHAGSLGICLDTAHCWAAGYDISSETKVRSVLSQLDSLVGLSNLKLIHINDTHVGCGAKVDRHAHIGEGSITLEGFKAILNYGWPRDFPFILETPENGTDRDRENLDKLSLLIEE